MSDFQNEPVLDGTSPSCPGQKRKGNMEISNPWEHFTKLREEDGSSEKCICNHCKNVFTYKHGTSYLIHHITPGVCPVYKQENRDQLETDSTYLDVSGPSETGNGEKTKAAGRSKAWEHFTKLIKEDGSSEKCMCNHCKGLFSSKYGTTHLLRHIYDGICPAYEHGKRDKLETDSTHSRGSSEPINVTATLKFNPVISDNSGQQTTDVHDQLSPVGLDTLEPEMHRELDQASKQWSEQFLKKRQSRDVSWMNELGACVHKLVDLTNERFPKCSSIKECQAPNFSISTAVRILNEMEDIPPSSGMYLDAFELLRNDGERECLICLPPEARRRWLQRMLHKHYPLRYNSNC